MEDHRGLWVRCMGAMTMIVLMVAMMMMVVVMTLMVNTGQAVMTAMAMGAGQHHLIMIRFAMLKAVHMIEMEVRAWVTVGVTKVGTS